MVKLRKTQFLAIQAILCSIILTFTIMPKLPAGLSLAFMPLIAIAVSGCLFGIKSSLFCGTFFGIISLIMHFINPGLLSPFFYNPLISIGARIFVGLTPGLLMHLFDKTKCPKYVSYSIASLMTAVVNTALVMGGILLFYYGKEFNPELGTAVTIEWFLGVLVANSLLEFALCLFLAPPIIVAVEKIVKKI